MRNERRRALRPNQRERRADQAEPLKPRSYCETDPSEAELLITDRDISQAERGEVPTGDEK